MNNNPDFMMQQSLHANMVVFNGQGLLLLPHPQHGKNANGQTGGIGKTDLSLRLIDAGGILVADDVVQLHAYAPVDAKPSLWVSAPPNMPAHLQGHMAVKGLGLLPMPWQNQSQVNGIVLLHAAPTTLPNLADMPAAWPRFALGGCTLPACHVWPLAASAVAQLRQWTRQLPAL